VNGEHAAIVFIIQSTRATINRNR